MSYKAREKPMSLEPKMTLEEALGDSWRPGVHWASQADERMAVMKAEIKRLRAASPTMSDKVRAELMRKADPYRWNDHPADEAEGLESAYMLGYRDAIDAALSLPQDEGRSCETCQHCEVGGACSRYPFDYQSCRDTGRPGWEPDPGAAAPAPSIPQGERRKPEHDPIIALRSLLDSHKRMCAGFALPYEEDRAIEEYAQNALDDLAEPAPAPEGPKEERGPYPNCTTPGTDCHAKNGKYCMNMMQCRPLGQVAHPASASDERAES